MIALGGGFAPEPGAGEYRDAFPGPLWGGGTGE